jgi:hypothetical protein
MVGLAVYHTAAALYMLWMEAARLRWRMKGRTGGVALPRGACCRAGPTEATKAAVGVTTLTKMVSACKQLLFRKEMSELVMFFDLHRFWKPGRVFPINSHE